MSDWWSRKLAETNPQPERQYSSVPPTTPPIRMPVSVPAAAPASPQQVARSNGRLLDENRAPTDQISMGEALRLWKGGEAMRREGNSSCPSCGSNLVFSRVGRGGTMVNGSQPAPRCFECGWNGMYDQGEQSSWAV
jgi:hypothetical protein